MILTTEQSQAITKGEAIRIVPPELAVECVLLRADVYDRAQSLLDDDGPLSEPEKIAAIRAAGERAGWDDPELDVYEEFRRFVNPQELSATAAPARGPRSTA